MTISSRDPLPELTYERAKVLNSAMLSIGLEREGLCKAKWSEITLLREASLLELALAGGVVSRHEDEQPPNADGSRSFSLKCDDRLAAAIYCFLRYAIPPAHTPLDDDNLLLKVSDTSHTYFLMCGAREAASLAQDEDDEVTV